jgi:hypothetical protein
VFPAIQPPDNRDMTTIGTITKLEAERLGTGVVIVRLSEAPSAGEWEWLLESVHEFVGKAPLVVLRGFGWSATLVARTMAIAICQDLRATTGAEVAIDASA